MDNGFVDATKDSTEDEDEVKLESGTETSLLSSLLFVYQSDWQKHLLSRYVNELVLLDYLQKTRYALPLFFIVFKTNTDYQIAATFVTENKKRKHCGSSGDYQKLESRIISSCSDSVFDSVTDCRETSMYLRRNIPYFKRENTALKIPIQITKTFVVVKLITFENFIRPHFF